MAARASEVIMGALQREADNELQAKLARARIAARQFFRAQDSEARKLGFRSYAAFARDLRSGAMRVQGWRLDDSELEMVGRWFFGLTAVNQWVLIFQYDELDERSPERRAKDHYHWGRDKYQRRVKSLLTELGGVLVVCAQN